MIKMIKDEWLRRLRSGEYEQCDGVLHNKKEDSYCCLGVLCQIYLDEKNLDWTPTNIEPFIRMTIHKAYDILPNEVVQWAGLSQSDPIVRFKNEHGESQIELSSLNDNFNLDFEDIAKIIEESAL